ncbi:MAG: hypothetical protein ACREX3_16385, partial [Gammaproteobacteria bacterium]
QVLRRATFAVNAHALLADRVSPEGPYDAAAANGLAVIVADISPGSEMQATKAGDRVLAPLKLLDILSSSGAGAWLPKLSLSLLEEGILLCQEFRHGRADDEWTRVTRHHIEALVYLDNHPSLGVLQMTDGQSFEEAVVTLYQLAVAEHYPSDPKDGSLFPDVVECPSCWRHTLITQGWDVFGIEVGEGTCIACGYERTYEDTINDALHRISDDDK